MMWIKTFLLPFGFFVLFLSASGMPTAAIAIAVGGILGKVVFHVLDARKQHRLEDRVDMKGFDVGPGETKAMAPTDRKKP